MTGMKGQCQRWMVLYQSAMIPTLRWFPRSEKYDSIPRRGDSHGGSIGWARRYRSHGQITRVARFGGLLASAATARRFAAFWLSRWFWMVVRAARPHRPTAWIGKHCAIGFTATTRTASRG